MASRTSRSSSRKPVTSQRVEFPVTETRTPFTTIILDVDRDNPRRLTVMLDGAPSSFIDLDAPDNVVFEYMEIFLAIIERMETGPLHAVHLGSAGSTMARAIEYLRPNSRQIGVDIDQQLLDFARKYFELPKAPKLRLRSGDARTQLETLHPGTQDLIIRDVFANAVTPQHLTTLQFTQSVLTRLNSGGLYLINCADKPPLVNLRRELATVIAAAQVHDEAHNYAQRTAVGLVAEPGILKGRRYGNLVIVVAKGAPEEVHNTFDLESAQLARSLRTLAVPAHIITGAQLNEFVGTASPLVDEAEFTQTLP